MHRGDIALAHFASDRELELSWDAVGVEVAAYATVGRILIDPTVAVIVVGGGVFARRHDEHAVELADAHGSGHAAAAASPAGRTATCAAGATSSRTRHPARGRAGHRSLAALAAHAAHGSGAAGARHGATSRAATRDRGGRRTACAADGVHSGRNLFSRA